MTTRICFPSGGASTTARGAALPPSGAGRGASPRGRSCRRPPGARAWSGRRARRRGARRPRAATPPPPPGGAGLRDRVTALLSNEMCRADGTLDADAPERLERELLAFSRQMRCCVFVSDYIYADGGQYDAWTEAYRRGLARLDRALAAACENAAELCCAQTYWYIGGFDR